MSRTNYLFRLKGLNRGLAVCNLLLYNSAVIIQKTLVASDCSKGLLNLILIARNYAGKKEGETLSYCRRNYWLICNPHAINIYNKNISGGLALC